jgi:hypothetical protein
MRPEFASSRHSDLAGTEPRRDPSPTVLRCGLFILALKASLQLAGFRRTLQWIERRLSRRPLGTVVEPEKIIRAERAVAMAAALYPGRALCLEQSLALYYVLRRSGIAAHLRLGVKAHPFGAHAWIEHEGVPVNDFAEHVRHFVPLPDLHL